MFNAQSDETETGASSPGCCFWKGDARTLVGVRSTTHVSLLLLRLFKEGKVHNNAKIMFRNTYNATTFLNCHLHENFEAESGKIPE